MEFLRHDSPLMRFLGKVADIMLVNVLFVVCSLPIVTAGAAITAANKVMQDFVLGTESSIVKRFFQTFRSEFRRSTAAWLLTLFVCACLCYDALLVFYYLDGGLASTCYFLLGFMAFVVVAIAVYVFTLLARYENKLKNHLRNACFLAIGKIHRTIPAVIVALIPLAIPFFFTYVFVIYIYVWVLLLFALDSLAISYLLKPVLLLNEKDGGSEKVE